MLETTVCAHTRPTVPVMVNVKLAPGAIPAGMAVAVHTYRVPDGATLVITGRPTPAGSTVV